MVSTARFTIAVTISEWSYQQLKFQRINHAFVCGGVGGRFLFCKISLDPDSLLTQQVIFFTLTLFAKCLGFYICVEGLFYS
jgi:hypothetical protein